MSVHARYSSPALDKDLGGRFQQFIIFQYVSIIAKPGPKRCDGNRGKEIELPTDIFSALNSRSPFPSCFDFEFSLDLTTDTQCTRLGIWKENIQITVNRVPRCPEQVELVPTEYGRKGDIHLRVSERHAQTAPRAPPEARHVARQITADGGFGFMEPSLRSEREAVLEQVFVMGIREVGYGDHGTGGEKI